LYCQEFSLGVISISNGASLHPQIHAEIRINLAELENPVDAEGQNGPKWIYLNTYPLRPFQNELFDQTNCTSDDLSDDGLLPISNCLSVSSRRSTGYGGRETDDLGNFQRTGLGTHDRLQQCSQVK
jgi:hypothetical protein